MEHHGGFGSELVHPQRGDGAMFQGLDQGAARRRRLDTAGEFLGAEASGAAGDDARAAAVAAAAADTGKGAWKAGGGGAKGRGKFKGKDKDKSKDKGKGNFGFGTGAGGGPAWKGAGGAKGWQQPQWEDVVERNFHNMENAMQSRKQSVAHSTSDNTHLFNECNLLQMKNLT